MTYKWRTGRYCVFKNFLHIVFVPKYRKDVFTLPMLEYLKEALQKCCKQMKGELLEFGGEHDHIHLMASIPPTMAICNFIGRLKGYSSYCLRKNFPEIKNKLWGDHLWSPSYCAVSCGGAPLNMVKEYIKNQRKPSTEKGIKQSLQETGRTGEKSRVKNKRSKRS